MPLLKLLRKNSDKNIDTNTKDKKSALGIKVIKAQQNPEPVYDLSSCSIGALPDDTFTFCKVLGKTHLLINDNSISNLQSGGSLSDLSSIKLLNASTNKLSRLPSDISVLQSLTSLDLSYNQLKSLPENLRKISTLEKLDISHNKFKTLPLCVCALEHLESLNICKNDITSLPNEFYQLHRTLVDFKADFAKFTFPDPEHCESVESLMTHLCDLNGTSYSPGSFRQEEKDKPTIPITQLEGDSIDSAITDYIAEKQNKTQQQQRFMEQEMQDAEKAQLDMVLRTSSHNKEQLLENLSSDSDNTQFRDYENQKQAKLRNHMRLEAERKQGQEKELEIYLDTAQNKESLLQNISCDESNFEVEVGNIVATKDKNRERFLEELTNAESNIESALHEIVNGAKMTKSADLMTLVEEQEIEMAKLLNHLGEVSSDLRRKDVMNEMQKTFAEELLLQYRSQAVEQKQKSFIDSLDVAIQLEFDHVESLIKSKSLNQSELFSDLLKNEKYQAEAFKVLLLKLDLKRNDFIRQIALVEYELMRLSSLEVKKKNCGISNATSATKSQRKTLVELLKSLMKAKDKRDHELENWFLELAHHHDSMSTDEDFWLCQYKKLMELKPPALVKAEQLIDEEVKEILYRALATDLLPLFARNGITLDVLVNMSETDYDNIGVGVATYQSIQRVLQGYLAEKKIGENSESHVPSAPDLTSHQDDDPIACAPPLEDRYFETECVICLDNEPCVIFMNCGHVCTCEKCCPCLSSCPLCRAEILSKCLFNRI